MMYMIMLCVEMAIKIIRVKPYFRMYACRTSYNKRPKHILVECVI